MLRFPNGKKYIGISHQPARRFQQHYTESNCGSRLPVHLAIALYGRESVVLEVIGEAYTREKIGWMEIEAIEKYGTLAPYGYNLKAGGGLGGGVMCEEARARMIERYKQIPPTPRMIAEAQAKADRKRAWEELLLSPPPPPPPPDSKRRTCSPETREKLRQKQLEHWDKPGVRESFSEIFKSHRKGKKLSPLHIAKLQAGRARNPPMRTQAQKDAHGDKVRGLLRSDETRRKMREAWVERKKAMSAN